MIDIIKNEELYARMYVNVDLKSPHFDVIYYKSSLIATVLSPTW